MGRNLSDGETKVSQPLIVTLRMDEAAEGFYEGLRRRYFPRERNLIPAHVSLFHQLPDEDETRQTLRQNARATSACVLREPRLRSMGRGVAVFFDAGGLAPVHAALMSAFERHLIPQDRQGFRPHIVIQNKVEPAVARRTLAEVQDGLLIEPLIEPLAIGFTLWRYLGGPWERLDDFGFGD